MRFDASYSQLEQATIIHGKVGDNEIMRALQSPGALTFEVRSAIASRIADKVMERLAPAIDVALKETYEKF